MLIQFTQGDIVNWLRFDLTRHQPTQRIQAADGRFYEVYEYRYTTPGFTSHIGWQNFGDASVPIAINLWVPLDSWFRPEERWLVDWDGDGSFDHAQSDVTSQVVDYDYEFGLQPQEDLRDLPLAAAQGSLRLLNLDGRYTPADAHELSSELETGRYLVRHQVSSPSASPFLDLDSPHTIWEGWLDAPKLERRGATDYAVFPLTGKSEAALDTEIDLFVGQANQMQVFREMASAAGATVGTRNNGPAHPQIHQAALTGLLRERLQDLARYAFGWVFEDAAGALNFRSGFDLAAQQPSGRTRFTPGVAANDIDVLVVADGTFGQRDAAGVRNRLERTTNVLVEQPTQTLYQSGMPGGQVAPGFEGIRQSDGRRRQWLGNAEIRVTDIDPLGVRFDQASISAAWTYQDARGTRVSIPNGMTRSAAVGHSSDISPFDTLTVEASVPLRPVIPLYFLGVTVTGRYYRATRVEHGVVGFTLAASDFGVRVYADYPPWMGSDSTLYLRGLRAISEPRWWAHVRLPAMQRFVRHRDPTARRGGGAVGAGAVVAAGFGCGACDAGGGHPPLASRRGQADDGGVSAGGGSAAVVCWGDVGGDSGAIAGEGGQVDGQRRRGRAGGR